MQRPSTSRTWANDESIDPTSELPVAADASEIGERDETPEESRHSTTKSGPGKSATAEAQNITDGPAVAAINRTDSADLPNGDKSNETGGVRQIQSDNVTEAVPQSDADWLRSKTSRLLGLLDEKEQADIQDRKPSTSPGVEGDIQENLENHASTKDSTQEAEHKHGDQVDGNFDLIRTTGRLFVRNLPYAASEADLGPIFSKFGKIDEVSEKFIVACNSSIALVMIILIGTSEVNFDVTRKAVLVDAC
jgi:multiple RNA-binding domain-containing protein 1